MRFGVVGCGTIAQIMHLPYIMEVPQTELRALVDPAPERANTLGDRYGVEHRFEDVGTMLDTLGDEIDAVIVATPPDQHAEVVERTLNANIHTLVEKPLAVSVGDADRMVTAAERSTATAMVGYMKRHDPTYKEAKQVVSNLNQIDLVSAYDVDPDHSRIINEVYDIIGGDIPDELIAASTRKRRADSRAVIDSEDDSRADDYHWHLEHICHDVNVLRGLFGAVERIDHVDVHSEGRYATAHLVYENGVRCTLDSGLSKRNWFEEFLRVDTPTGMVELEWANSFIKNSPTTLRVKCGTERVSDETRTPSYVESFKYELEHFVDCIEGEAMVQTPFEQGREDIRLIADLFRYDDGGSLIGTY